MEDKMENRIQIFEHKQFGKIRVIIIGGRIHFVAVDVCRALEIKNSRAAIARLGKDEKMTVDLTDSHSGKRGGAQFMTVVNEPGFYHLVFSSRKKEALAFQWWVYHEVLPSINATGSYSVAPAAAPAQLKSSKRSEGQLSPAFVYVLLMSNNLVLLTKLGQSKNIRKRIAQIKRETGLTVKDIYFTPLMPRDKARLIEGLCKEKFSEHRVKGEFFSAKFDDVCAAVNRFMEMAFATVPQPQVSDFERAEKILAIVNAMPEGHERNQMLLTFGKLIADEKFT
ncbi:MAG: GIY-YIG nuclease family protein [Selenomonadaceae bacterium]|nr:GIY-YIG nuclease family protein [Selenomonadaceae bacterium]